MKILMICNADLCSKESLGVIKKINGQYKAFNNLGCETYLACLKNGNAILKHRGTERVIIKRRKKTVLTVFAMFKSLPELVTEESIDVCYIRYPLADLTFIKMLKQLHEISSVVIEMPTFPYDQQASNNRNIVSQFNLMQDKHYRKSLKKYVNYFATYGNQKTIYDVQCIGIKNGIDVSSIKYLGDKLNYNDTVNLIGVARIQRDHGYDRIIEGLQNYYNDSNLPKEKIYFHIVGKGEAEKELREKVQNYCLDEYVIFHGVKSGEELEQLYLTSNIGVGVLGAYRSGSNSTSALKDKEYCAVGIPIIGSVPDNTIPESVGYYKLFDNNDSPVDMNEIIDYFNFIKENPELHKQLRILAENELSWERQLNIIISALKNMYS